MPKMIETVDGYSVPATVSEEMADELNAAAAARCGVPYKAWEYRQPTDGTSPSIIAACEDVMGEKHYRLLWGNDQVEVYESPDGELVALWIGGNEGLGFGTYIPEPPEPSPAIVAHARQFGREAAEAYAEEFGVSPAEDGVDAVEDFDSMAWTVAISALLDAGATTADLEACLAAWRAGFWGAESADFTTAETDAADRAWDRLGDD